MKQMKKLVCLCCVGLCLLMFSCKPKETETPADTKISKIVVTDQYQQEIDKVYAYQETNPASYLHNDVYVYAYYEDKTTKDVTSFATFSEVDLTMLGEQEITVSYLNHEDTYILVVTENPVVRITLSTSSAKKIFEIGELYQTNGLVVKGTYKSGKEEILNQYTVKITDMNNISYSKALPFSKTGLYDVSIKAGTASANYQIAVVAKSYSSKSTFNLTGFGQSLSYDENGECLYSPEGALFEDSQSKILVNQAKIHSKNEHGNPLSLSYNGSLYTKALEITTEQDFTFVLNQTTDLVLLAGKSMEEQLLFSTTEGETWSQYAIGNLEETMSVLWIRLDAGSYTLQSISDSVLIYQIEFNYVEGEPSSNITGIRVDTTYAKLIYELGEYFNYSNLIVIANLTTGGTESLRPTDWTYEVSQDGIVKEANDPFTKTGEYLVTITYRNHHASYGIIVQNTSKNG
ncbi:MAG: bacterial Ig-like domain-containing protein [Anaeroplasmataceae bacterium]|nr:bacterial Ig-like domain-containing protein [Anaeroplasmataceae bacterium]